MTHKIHVHANKNINSPSYINDKIKNSGNDFKRNILTQKKFLKKLIHPDYILFDWEYFSCELEFE